MCIGLNIKSEVFITSDYSIRFIPEKLSFALKPYEIEQIKGLNWYGNKIEIIQNYVVEFADAGSDFETVSCPFCRKDLNDWWGDAMDAAYLDGQGFVNIKVITPCCNRDTTLHELDYHFPQGMYKTMIEVYPDTSREDFSPEDFSEEIGNGLWHTTGERWRVIHAHY
ncbi:hypothetical protein LBYZC6_53980 [Lacrimispora brassicae]